MNQKLYPLLLGAVALTTGCATSMVPIDSQNTRVSPVQRTQQPAGTAVGQYAVGRIDLSEGRYESAAYRFGQAVQLDPKMLDAYNALGVAHGLAGNFHKAVTAFDAALAIAPDAPHILNNMGFAQLKLGRLDEAWVSLKKSHELDSRNVMTRENIQLLAQARRDAGVSDDAQRLLLAAASSPAAQPAAAAVSPPRIARAPSARAPGAAGVATSRPSYEVVMSNSNDGSLVQVAPNLYEIRSAGTATAVRTPSPAVAVRSVAAPIVTTPVAAAPAIASQAVASPVAASPAVASQAVASPAVSSQIVATPIVAPGVEVSTTRAAAPTVVSPARVEPGFHTRTAGASSATATGVAASTTTGLPANWTAERVATYRAALQWMSNVRTRAASAPVATTQRSTGGTATAAPTGTGAGGVITAVPLREARTTIDGVEISNAVGMPHLAKRTARSLSQIGISTVRVSDYPTFGIQQTEIHYRDGHQSSARALLEKLPVAARMVRSETLRPGVNVRLVIGRDMVGGVVAFETEAVPAHGALDLTRYASRVGRANVDHGWRYA